MRVLAIDTALAACSVAFCDGQTLLAQQWVPLKRGHAERLLPMIEETRGAAGIGYGDLDLIAVTVGPGTFTGVRIGLAAARGLSLACNCPVMGVGTLQALAWSVAESGPVLACIDARRGELYWQDFDSGRTPTSEPQLGNSAALLTAQEGRSGVLVGSGSAVVGPDLANWTVSGAPSDPSAATIALHCARLEPPAAGHRPSPLYLRAPDAKLPAAGPA